MLVLPKGTEITCPQCHKVMCRLIVDLRSGDLIASKSFESVNAQVIPGTPMSCPNDGEPFGAPVFGGYHKLHTKDGWV